MSLLSVSVIVIVIFLVPIKLQNLKIKFSGHF